MMFHLSFPLLIFVLPTLQKFPFSWPLSSWYSCHNFFQTVSIFLFQHPKMKPDLESSLRNQTQHEQLTRLKGDSSHRAGLERLTNSQPRTSQTRRTPVISAVHFLPFFPAWKYTLINWCWETPKSKSEFSQLKKRQNLNFNTQIWKWFYLLIFYPFFCVDNRGGKKIPSLW